MMTVILRNRLNMNNLYMLDTNVYALLFHRTNCDAAKKVRKVISQSRSEYFYISEITSLEIHSVIGKYRRGIQHQRQICNRKIISGRDICECNNMWVQTGSRRISRKLYRDLQKLIKDIESQRGPVKINILNINERTILEGSNLLIKYADRFKFGSHDALIAGTLLNESKNNGLPLTMVTSDRGFKAVLNEEKIPFIDPNGTQYKP